MPPLGLIGPLAGWELRRLVRRGLIPRVWLLLLYFDLLVFVVFTALWFYPTPLWDALAAGLFRLSARDLAAFADVFALVLLEVQLVVVVAFTPALAASAVAEEKDRQTLPLLLTTQLTDREIVLGKAAGRIAFVFVVLAGGLPVLLLTLHFGRTDLGFLATSYALTVGTIILCAGIGLNVACRTPDFRSALLRAYFLTAVLVFGAFVPPLVFVSPFGLLILARNGSSNVLLLAWGYVFAQALLAALLLVSATRSLRLREPGAGPPLTSAFPLPPRPADPLLLPPKRALPPELPPLEGADPVLWKERAVAWRPTWVVPSLAKILSALTASAAVVLFLGGALVVLNRVEMALNPAQVAQVANQPGAPDLGGWLLTAAGVLAAGRYLLPLAVGLSGAIAGERFRRTLDVLLSTPLDRRAILRAKVQAHVERGSVFVAIAVAAVGMAFTADGSIRIGASAAGLVLASIGLVVGLGAWLTVRCATDVRAFRLLIFFVLLAVGWPAGVWNLLRYATDVPRELIERGLLLAVGVCSVAGLLFWWLAERRLGKGE